MRRRVRALSRRRRRSRPCTTMKPGESEIPFGRSNRPVRAEDEQHPEDQEALSRWSGRAMASASATAHAATKTAAAKHASFEGKAGLHPGPDSSARLLRPGDRRQGRGPASYQINRGVETAPPASSNATRPLAAAATRTRDLLHREFPLAMHLRRCRYGRRGGSAPLRVSQWLCEACRPSPWPCRLSPGLSVTPPAFVLCRMVRRRRFGTALSEVLRPGGRIGHQHRQQEFQPFARDWQPPAAKRAGGFSRRGATPQFIPYSGLSD